MLSPTLLCVPAPNTRPKIENSYPYYHPVKLTRSVTIVLTLPGQFGAQSRYSTNQQWQLWLTCLDGAVRNKHRMAFVNSSGHLPNDTTTIVDRPQSC